LGFLGVWPFGREGPRGGGLDSLGFPWILSSESRLFNGLHGFSWEEFFSFPFPPGSEITGIGDKVLACGSAGLFMAQAYPAF
jgi:hypothetical protein